MEDPCVRPAIPEILALCLALGKDRLCARRSDMNEADDALSSNALACTVLPSGEVTEIWQVINSTFDFSLIAEFVTTVSPSKRTVAGVEFTLDCGGDTTAVGFGVPGERLAGASSLCSRVWWAL